MRALSFPFRLNARGKLSEAMSYSEIVEAQIIDALVTNLGERVMRPRYGCDIQAAIFDPSDELQRQDAAGLLKTRLGNLVPRALIEGVTLVDGNDPSTMVFNITYRPTPYSEATNVAVPVASEFITRTLSEVTTT
jgi:phage baseplate assembly protein W